jgi:uncharacterized protein with HEPN domain
MTRHDDERVSDIIDAAGQVAMIVAGGEVAYREDRVRQLAVERLLEIIGESARAMSDASRDRYPGVPWADIVGLRGCRVISCSAMQQSDEPGPVPATGASQRPQGIGHSRSDCTGGTDASPPAQTSATASQARSCADNADGDGRSGRPPPARRSRSRSRHRRSARRPCHSTHSNPRRRRGRVRRLAPRDDRSGDGRGQPLPAAPSPSALSSVTGPGAPRSPSAPEESGPEESSSRSPSSSSASRPLPPRRSEPPNAISASAATFARSASFSSRNDAISVSLAVNSSIAGQVAQTTLVKLQTRARRVQSSASSAVGPRGARVPAANPGSAGPDHPLVHRILTCR